MRTWPHSRIKYADVVELADTYDLGSYVVRHAGSSPVIRTIKEPGIDTKSVPGLFFFILKFTPKRGIFSNFATHFDFRCPPLVLMPTLRITKHLHIALSIR